MKYMMLVACLMLMSFSLSKAQTRFGITFSDGNLRGFNIAVGGYDRMPPGNYAWMRRAGLPEEEIPVVFFIARHTGWELRSIVRLRLGGLSWWDVSHRCGLDPALYGLPYRSDPGYSLRGPHEQWHDKYKFRERHVFSDADIIGAVNGHHANGMREGDRYANNRFPRMRDRDR